MMLNTNVDREHARHGDADRPVELADLDAAGVEAIRRIWEILARELGPARGLNRQIKATNERGTVLMVVLFADVVCQARLAAR